MLALAKIMRGSSTDSVAVLTVTVSPLTVRSPVTVKFPPEVTLAPLKVKAVVVPDLIIKLPEVFVAEPK